ncbi:hypothetical protein [Pseudomonas sp. 460]|uniref:hypothetical protein n=1 Tax=Pseudomonas sp. 460 TaxID=2485142 RepID=UPI00104940ED|nr:hypothetical protein [Pseudomonas sp. 460]TCV51422.1 hypothetical protein EDB99_10788 [Pseudomonas sp. 460]
MTTERPQERSTGLSLGDWIECDFTHPSEHTRAAQLNTRDAMLYGLKLLSDPKSGWRRATRDWSARKATDTGQVAD